MHNGSGDMQAQYRIGICALPIELIVTIFRQLDVPTLLACRRVGFMFDICWNCLKSLNYLSRFVDFSAISTTLVYNTKSN
jgi:hypothetical protein